MRTTRTATAAASHSRSSFTPPAPTTAAAQCRAPTRTDLPRLPSGPTHRHHSATATPPFARAQLRQKRPQARAPFPPRPAARALFKDSARPRCPFLRRRCGELRAGERQQRWALRTGRGRGGRASRASVVLRPCCGSCAGRSRSRFREARGRTSPRPCPARAAPEGGLLAGWLRAGAEAPCRPPSGWGRQ